MKCAVTVYRMFQPQCRCWTTRDRVVIPQNREDHIIRRHFKFPPINENFEPRRSLFLEHVITPEALFMEVVRELRNGLQSEERGRQGRYVYYVPFPYDVEVFPFDPRGPYTSNIVKIICDYVLCQYCFRHCPSEVITIFPA